MRKGRGGHGVISNSALVWFITVIWVRVDLRDADVGG